VNEEMAAVAYRECSPRAVDESRFETNLLSHRKLHPDLRQVDLRLQVWGGWAKPRYTELGYPTRCSTELVNEGGILAKDVQPTHPPEWPVIIVVCDRHVAQLPTRHLAAVMATYFHLALAAEQRALIYARLARHLAKTRKRIGVRNYGGGESLGSEAFRRDLDRARWTIKHSLQL
jgi:hypothetical protein